MSNVSIKEALYKILINSFQNCKVLLIGCKIRRDPHVWIFGAWMGNRFADNPRYLFQFLNSHKEQYGIKEIVWATRSEKVFNEVNAMGYKVVLIGTEESNYFHSKAGVHVICNSANKDIDSSLSAGAKKIQLWHGVGGCKAVGRLNRGNISISQKLADVFIWPYYESGNWFNAYYLASSPENARVVKAEHGCKDSHIFEAITPRLCNCEKYKDSEKELIRQIVNYKEKGFKIVMYLPTFRDNNASFITPLEINGLQDVLYNKRIIWIQKNHYASEKKDEFVIQNVLNIDPDFDINVLYDYIDLLVTDYSSAASDAIFKHIRTLEYCPDMDDYINNNRKFVADFSLYHAEDTVTSPGDFIDVFQFRLENETNSIKIKYENVRKLLFADHSASYSDFMKILLDRAKIKL